MTKLLLRISQAVFVFFLTIMYQILSSVIIVISLAQCSHKKPRIQDRKDKTEVKKKVKSAHTPAPEEKIRDKQDKSNSPDEKKGRR
ncbi:hypothetical protein QQG55_48890 [Brugia pahangi]